MAKKKPGKKLPNPSGTQLALFETGDIATPPTDNGERREHATTAMMRADERAILAEARGEMAAEWVYQYERKGGDLITGISYPGFRQLYRVAFKELVPQWAEFPTVVLHADDPRGPTLVAYGVIVHPRNSKLKYPAFAEEPLKKHGAGGTSYPNFFARAVVIGKLIRNAIKGMIDDRIAGRFLAMCLKQKARITKLEEGQEGGGEVEAGNATKTAKIGLLMNVAREYGVEINKPKVKEQFREFIARQFKCRLSAMHEKQVDAVTQWLRDSVAKHGKDAFQSAVDHVSVQSA